MPSFRKYFLAFVLLAVAGCGQGNMNPERDYKHDNGKKEVAGYADDDYCATIDYSNPNTGTKSVYTLIVAVQDNDVMEINWPNGGVLDSHHFVPAELDSDGRAHFNDDRGNSYDIQIKGDSKSCFDGVAGVQQCKGITRKGLRCKNKTANENGYCNKHQRQAE